MANTTKRSRVRRPKKPDQQVHGGLNKAMSEQVDATIWLIKNNLFSGLDEHQERYIKDHLVNLVESCLSIQMKDPVAMPPELRTVEQLL